MSITMEFLEILAAIVALISLSIAVGFALGKGARFDDHTAEDDAEQIEYLREVRRVKAYPTTGEMK